MHNCPSNPGGAFNPPFALSPTPSPRTMPVNIPFSLIGITIVTLDGYGNVTIKVDQPYPNVSQETGHE
jgi:hypothetical protein